ncbi:hypothetical protein M378DRAFT_396450 [Amanita muscaria Koide BX008]|uniref:Uncharacterized protein n=1 Tax=Amanita muscaria (strain Koide BX008) TaxID=946122 RepID=A0A0C2WM68_AMAMK|nr:hypothetical protein M378DRAFT_396450 [Amanita muscaria Koide BX008]
MLSSLHFEGHPSDKRSSRWLPPPTDAKRQASKRNHNVLEATQKGAVFSVIRASACCHRLDVKDAAFVKMRNSVSFCKQILFEYVLRKKLTRGVGFIYLFHMVRARA